MTAAAPGADGRPVGCTTTDGWDAGLAAADAAALAARAGAGASSKLGGGFFFRASATML